ncbi:unnamed protein product, partial [marine sediment metagenome]
MNTYVALKKLASAFITEVMQNLSSGEYPSGADESGRGYVKIQDTFTTSQVAGGDTSIEVVVGNKNAPYTKAFEFGSGVQGKKGKTYPIFPRNAPALAFYWEKIGMQTIVPKGGGFKSYIQSPNVYVIGKGKVDHPGIKAKPFV